MLVQNVDALHLALEILLFVLVKQHLVGNPQLIVLLQMVAIVERSEWLCEIFDVQGHFSLVAQTIVDLHTVPTFVDVEKALHSHISSDILGNNL